MPLGTFLLWTALGSAVWNGLLIGAGMLLGTQYELIEQYIDVVNNVVYFAIGAAVVVFFMRRWDHRRRPGTAPDESQG